MRPEIIPHLLDLSVGGWTALLCVLSVGLGIYNGAMLYVRKGRTHEARTRAIWRAAAWVAGGFAATYAFVIPDLIAPDAAAHGGTYDLPLHTYGFAIALGFMLATSLSAREAARNGIFPGATPPRNNQQRARARDTVLDLAFWVLLAAIAGSRLYFIAVNWTGPEGYAEHPGNILKFWTGGLVFYGGFIGAVLASIIYAARARFTFIRLADLAIPTVSLGQFFGRLGCFSAGCCYGKPISGAFSAIGVRFPKGSLAWDVLVNQRHTLADTATRTDALWPSQLIDGGGQLLIFLFLTFFLKPRKSYDGQIVLTWLFLYPALRFSDEFVRGDTERGVYTTLHISAGQLTSLFLMLVALGLLLWTHPRSTGQKTVATG